MKRKVTAGFKQRNGLIVLAARQRKSYRRVGSRATRETGMVAVQV